MKRVLYRVLINDTHYLVSCIQTLRLTFSQTGSSFRCTDSNTYYRVFIPKGFQPVFFGPGRYIHSSVFSSLKELQLCIEIITKKRGTDSKGFHKPQVWEIYSTYTSLYAQWKLWVHERNPESKNQQEVFKYSAKNVKFILCLGSKECFREQKQLPRSQLCTCLYL